MDGPIRRNPDTSRYRAKKNTVGLVACRVAGCQVSGSGGEKLGKNFVEQLDLGNLPIITSLDNVAIFNAVEGKTRRRIYVEQKVIFDVAIL